VVVAVDAHRDPDSGEINPTLLAETMAHELGHQFGLHHTTEAQGDDHDLFDDTPACTPAMDANGDGELAAEECPDGDNVMFWTAAEFDQTLFSLGQSDVVFFSPVSQ
jgi:hypothetical protein